jgi:hypothetical protein
VRRWLPIVLTAGSLLAAGVFASRPALFFRLPAPRRLSQAEAALFAAADSGDRAGVAAALAAGASVESRNHEGETPLIAACRSGALETVRYLLSRRAAVDATTLLLPAWHYDREIHWSLISTHHPETPKCDKRRDGSLPALRAPTRRRAVGRPARRAAQGRTRQRWWRRSP